MFTMAARRMGYRVAVFAPEESSPAGQIAFRQVHAPYDDLEAVARFAQQVSVVTFEFENVLTATAEEAARHAPVRPAGSLLHTTQNRLREKRALTKLGIPVAQHVAIEKAEDLDSAGQTIPGPAILKTAAWGYDGKGQCRVERPEDLPSAWQSVKQSPCVLEATVPFEREISVVGVRGLKGEVVLYDPFENDHANHILDVTTWPAKIGDLSRQRAHEVARAILEGLDVVGVLCVEMFLLSDGEILVNELAPRPHNSGHLTIEASASSQFEQQVRSVSGLPLGSPERRTGGAAMANLLGDLWTDHEPNWAAALEVPGVSLHLYGKEEPRPGRKMGHLTALAGDPTAAAALVRNAREALTRIR